MYLKFAITTAPGLESLVRDETRRIGAENVQAENRLVRAE